MPLLQSSSSVRPPLDPLAVDLAREVVGEHYPAELTLFDAVLSEFHAYPDRLAAKALRAPVGMGIDLTLVTPYVLDAASFLGGVVAAKTAETAYDAVRERVSQAWAARRARRGDPPKSTVDSGPTPAAFDDGGITVVVTAHLSARGADSATAHAVAEHVVGKLLLPPAGRPDNGDPARRAPGGPRSAGGHPVAWAGPLRPAGRRAVAGGQLRRPATAPPLLPSVLARDRRRLR